MISPLELGFNRMVQSLLNRSGHFNEAGTIQTEEESVSARLREKSGQIMDSFGSDNVPPGGFYLRQTPDVVIGVGQRKLTLRLSEVVELGRTYVLSGSLEEVIKNQRLFLIPSLIEEGKSPKPPRNWEDKDAGLEDLKLAEYLLRELQTGLTVQASVKTLHAV